MIEVSDMMLAQLWLIIESMRKAGIKDPVIRDALKWANRTANLRLNREIRRAAERI